MEMPPKRNAVPPAKRPRAGRQGYMTAKVRSQDTPCPFPGAPAHAENGVAHTQEVIERLNSTQRGQSWSLPVPEGACARVPAVSIKRWREALVEIVDTDAGRAAARQRGTGIANVLECAPHFAGFAESDTGRGITAAVATMAARAGVTEERMRRALYVLRDVGLAKVMVTGRPLRGIEIAAARAHHGGHQHQAANVWALTLPRVYLS